MVMMDLQDAKTLKEVVSTALLVVAALAAAWKWWFAEWLRFRSEIPTLDGDLKVRSVPLSDRHVAVEIETTWRNKGAVPIYVETSKTVVRVFTLSNNAHPEEIVFSPDTDGQPETIIHPLEQMGFYFLEPKTESQINTIVALRKGQTYMVQLILFAKLPKLSRWSLARLLSRAAGSPVEVGDVSWVRSRLFSTRLDGPPHDSDSPASAS